MEDVTARRRAEEALLKAGALQSAIFNSANFSSIATDENGVIQIFNVGAERMLGYTAAEVMNKNTPADISDPQEVIARAKALSVELGTAIAPGFEALVFKARRGIEDIYELTYIRKDGSRFPAIVSVTALRDALGGIIGYLLIGTDNTARKQVEARSRPEECDGLLPWIHRAQPPCTFMRTGHCTLRQRIAIVFTIRRMPAIVLTSVYVHETY
jgi:PAS domain-containing protein